MSGRVSWPICLLVMCGGVGLQAQSARVIGVTTVQSVGARPLVEDSVLASETSGTGPYRLLPNGQIVRCVTGEPYCHYRRSGDAVTAVPFVQDLQAAAWGLGQGISLHAYLRARESFGGDEFLWPRASDRFDAIEAYLQVDRARLRARLGRQSVVNGLGLYNFDGGAVLFRQGPATIEAFGGVSLVAGLNESHVGGTLGDVDDLPPDERGWLIGARGGARIGRSASIAGVYQRVIREDQAGLYSERVALDGAARALGIAWDASWTYDLQEGDVNEARLRAARDFAGRFSGTVEARRHRPYFEAWTIWGVFSPVAFDEVRATAGWHDQRQHLALDVNGGWRRYEPTDAGLQSEPLRNDGWRAGAGLEWTPAERWFAHADYNVDIGFGASRSDAAAGVRWSPDDDVFIGGTLSAFQNIYEFRVGTGRVLGLGVEGGMRVARDARLIVEAGFYRHSMSGNAPSTDWSQRRLATRFEWTLGRDPGASLSRTGAGR
jgi:hypothetical protein